MGKVLIWWYTKFFQQVQKKLGCVVRVPVAVATSTRSI